VTVPNQRAWGWDYLWQATASVTGTSILDTVEANAAGTGGGFSVLEPTPSYQRGVPGTQDFHAVQYLTPTDFQTTAPGVVEPTAWTFNPTPGVSQVQGSGRAVPDLDSFLGHRVGLWNPFIYAFAVGSRSPFTPLQESGTGHDNLFYTGHPGQVLNQGSGLGLPTGDVVNLAARPEQAAAPDEIIMGLPTLPPVRGAVTAKPCADQAGPASITSRTLASVACGPKKVTAQVRPARSHGPRSVSGGSSVTRSNRPPSGRASRISAASSASASGPGRPMGNSPSQRSARRTGRRFGHCPATHTGGLGRCTGTGSNSPAQYLARASKP
jgi:hypothetical protein